ncbi:MAG: TolC family protein [Xanthomonadales bacterium]|nr:TolC family protein [Xanthomonadales bacterium]
MRLRCTIFGLLASLVLASATQAREVVIGVVLDGPMARQPVSLAVVQQEVQALLGKEHQISLPETKQLDGSWTPAGVRRALQQQLADPAVDIVLAVGLLAPSEAAALSALPKPVLAPFVADTQLQNLPLKDETSGRRNFVYLYDFGGVRRELQDFQRLVDFRHAVLVADASWIEALPGLSDFVAELARELNVNISITPAVRSASEVLAAIDNDVDAVYLTPLPRFDPSQFKQLIQGINASKLPSFSSLGRAEVVKGVMAASSGTTVNEVNTARRIATLIQRMLRGVNAGDLSVSFDTRGRTVINMQTAAAIGFAPSWETMNDAELLFEQPSATGGVISLVRAIEQAVAANPALEALGYSVDIARDDIRLARSALLPQLNLGAVYTRIDEDRALFLAGEELTQAEVLGSQVIYADQLAANHRISELLYEATDRDYRSALLDTMQAAATAYLTAMRAMALEAVRKSNVEVTRTNLDLARTRNRIGYSGRADVLRWESQIARDLQELIAATAVREQTQTLLNLVLSQPLEEPVAVSEDGLGDLLPWLESDELQQFVDNPLDWELFQRYYRDLSLNNSPELESLDRQIEAQQRQLTADSRRRYMPEVTFGVRRARTLDRGGAGSDEQDISLDDDEWSIGIQARLPLYAGGAIRARVSQSRYQLEQLRAVKHATREEVTARMRAALQQVGGTYPAIALSRDSAKAARANLDLVADQYAKGAVGVTELVDAQDASLQADLAAAESRYAFLVDFVEVLRAGGSFDLLMAPAKRVAWINEVSEFYRSHGAQR